MTTLDGVIDLHRMDKYPDEVAIALLRSPSFYDFVPAAKKPATRAADAEAPADPAEAAEDRRHFRLVLVGLILNVVTKGSIGVYETLGVNFPGSGEAASKKAAEAKKVIPIMGTYKLDVEDLKRRFLNAIEGEMNSLAKSMYVQLERSEGSIVLMPNDQFMMNLGGPEVPAVSGTWSLKDGALTLKSEGEVNQAALVKGVITMVVNKTPTGTRNFVLQAPDARPDKAK